MQRQPFRILQKIGCWRSASQIILLCTEWGPIRSTLCSLHWQIIELWNHRKCLVGRHLQRSSRSTPGPSQNNTRYNTLCLKAFSKHFLNSVGCDHFPREPVPVPSHPPGETPFAEIQRKPPLTPFHTISSNSLTGHKSEESCPPISSWRYWRPQWGFPSVSCRLNK